MNPTHLDVIEEMKDAETVAKTDTRIDRHFSLNHCVRTHHHVRWDREADLLRSV